MKCLIDPTGKSLENDRADDLDHKPKIGSQNHTVAMIC
jgi:hypothetical protein